MWSWVPSRTWETFVQRFGTRAVTCLKYSWNGSLVCLNSMLCEQHAMFMGLKFEKHGFLIRSLKFMAPRFEKDSYTCLYEWSGNLAHLPLCIPSRMNVRAFSIAKITYVYFSIFQIINVITHFSKLLQDFAFSFYIKRSRALLIFMDTHNTIELELFSFKSGQLRVF